MTAQIHADEQFLTVAEIADRLKVKHDTVRRLFLHEPGVVIIRFPRKGQKKESRIRRRTQRRTY
jgi:transcriptional regulator GlxA family with amidase domain